MDDLDTEQLEMILANAEMVNRDMGPISGINFGYNAESVQWIDDFINRQRIRQNVGPEFPEGLINVLGSWLGECIRHCYGGEWRYSEYGLSIRFNERNAVYPFNKTSKQFENGEGDSIYSFFTMIPIVFGDKSPLLDGKPSPLPNAGKKKKPFWKFW